MDYIVAVLIIPMTAIYLVHWHYVWRHLQDILLVLFVFLVVLVEVQNTSDSFTAPALIVAASLGIPLCYWIAYFVYMRWIFVPPPSAARGQHKKKPWRPTWLNWGYFPKYEWGALLASIGLSAVAISLFATQGMFAYAWVANIHALWHIFAAFGQYFLMEIKAPRKGSIGYYKATRETWARIRALGGMEKLLEQADQIDISKPINFYVEK